MDYPILTLDKAHNHAAGNEQAAFYSIRPAAGIILIPETDLGEINALQIILGENAIYHLEWDGKISIMIDGNSVSPLKADTAFSGFNNGRAVIGIGAYKSNPAGNTGFYVAYALMIDIV